MNNVIKVPYMPINAFETPDEFFEETDELIEENTVFENDNEKDLSEDLLLVLHGLGMEKYIKLFKKHNVELDTLLKLNETDLQELGITDPNDIANIIKKLGGQKRSNNSEFIVKENHIEDLQIVRNVQRQLLLLQNYSAYVEVQLKKNKLTDYKLDSNDFASLFLKAFTEGALLQSQILSNKIYDENSENSLIDKILKKYNLTLPPIYQKALPKKKRKGNSTLKKVVIVMGASSLILIFGKLILSKKGL